jgi:ATP-dependent RNA helicase DeaD
MTEHSFDSSTPSDSAATPSSPSPKASFADLGLRPEVLKALADMGFAEPMEVQQATLPMVRQGHDILVQSRTGSGKTAAFAIPFADWIADSSLPSPQALVLLPTRELALQVAAETARICATLPLSVVPVYGGSPMGRQIEQLRAGAHIVCGTPGRILDHIRRGTLRLDKIKCVVLDECDEMLSMGFQEDIEAILGETPTERQTLLFSATIPEGIQRLSRRFMRSPETLKLSADFVGVHEIRHTYYSIPGGHRETELVRVLAFEEPERAVIFCNTREETGRVAEHLRRQGMNAVPISSDLSQSEREDVMSRMRAGTIRFLVATDVAARGIDIENLPCVINYTFPESPEIYIHRTGRTGRAGRSGHAVSLIGPTEVGSFYYLKLLYKIRPEERSLPSEAEVRSHHEGERLAHLRGLFPGDPGAEWHSLARRLMSGIDAERLVGSLLRSALGTAKSESVHSDEPQPVPVAVVETGPEAPPAPASVTAGESERRERSARGEPRGRGYGERDRIGRNRGPRGERERGSRHHADGERGPRERGERERGKAGESSAEQSRRPVPSDDTRERGKAGESSAEQSRRPVPSDDTREFWEVWSEEVGRTPAQDQPSKDSDSSGSAPPTSTDEPGAATVRLYVNLGRKDGVTSEQVADQLSASGVAVPASAVELMNTHSYINVAREVADILCSKVTGQLYSGRAVVCEPARPPRRR